VNRKLYDAIWAKLDKEATLLSAGITINGCKYIGNGMIQVPGGVREVQPSEVKEVGFFIEETSFVGCSHKGVGFEELFPPQGNPSHKEPPVGEPFDED
jgi:hypothetical protein